jgi:hypothetical protein
LVLSFIYSLCTEKFPLHQGTVTWLLAYSMNNPGYFSIFQLVSGEGDIQHGGHTTYYGTIIFGDVFSQRGVHLWEHKLLSDIPLQTCVMPPETVIIPHSTLVKKNYSLWGIQNIDNQVSPLRLHLTGLW